MNTYVWKRLLIIGSAFILSATSWAGTPATVYNPAEDPALEEVVPHGVTPDPAQRAAVLHAVPYTYLTKAEYDEQGNVIGIYLSNHKAKSNCKAVFEKYGENERPGVTAEVVADFAVFTELRDLEMLQQDPSPEGFEAAQNWSKLKSFRIEHMDDPGFMLYVNALPTVKWLELKHLFGTDGTYVDQIGTLPNLKRLELDNDSAQQEALVFLQRNPSIEDFELHRSDLSNEEIGQLVDYLPNLKRLALKPGRAKEHFNHESLAHVKRLNQLQVFGFHHWSDDMFVWENGIEHLASIPSLEFVEAPSGGRGKPTPAAIIKLLEVRPDVQIADGKAVVITEEE